MYNIPFEAWNEIIIELDDFERRAKEMTKTAVKVTKHGIK